MSELIDPVEKQICYSRDLYLSPDMSVGGLRGRCRVTCVYFTDSERHLLSSHEHPLEIQTTHSRKKMIFSCSISKQLV